MMFCGDVSLLWRHLVERHIEKISSLCAPSYDILLSNVE